MELLDNFIVKSARNAPQPDEMGRQGQRNGTAVDAHLDAEGQGGRAASKRVSAIRREGVLCKRGDRWLKKWVERRVLLQCGIVSYFKLPGNQGVPRGQMVLKPDSWARPVDHFDRDFAFQIGSGLEDDGGMVWTFQVIAAVLAFSPRCFSAFLPPSLSPVEPVFRPVPSPLLPSPSIPLGVCAQNSRSDTSCGPVRLGHERRQDSGLRQCVRLLPRSTRCCTRGECQARSRACL